MLILILLQLEYELCFDEFIKAKSISLPHRILEMYKSSQPQACTTQVFPEANLVILTINQTIFIWQYYVSNNIEGYDLSYELESNYNPKVQL